MGIDRTPDTSERVINLDLLMRSLEGKNDIRIREVSRNFNLIFYFILNLGI